MKIKRLREKFVRKGFMFESVFQNENFVVYKGSNKEKDEWYELFQYRLRDYSPYGTEDYDKTEVYPNDEDFGEWAWCYSDIICLERGIKKHFGEEGLFSFKSKVDGL